MAESAHKSPDHPTETPDVSHVRNVDVTHEHSDVNVRAILTFVAVLTVMTLVVCFGLYFLFWYYNAQIEAGQPKPGPMAMTREERYPPEPRLQNAPGFGLQLENGEWINLEHREPAAQYEELRKQWEQTLREGLKDQSGRAVGRSIDDAMKAIVNEKLVPTRSRAGADKLDDYGINLPTDASSGRATEKLR